MIEEDESYPKMVVFVFPIRKLEDHCMEFTVWVGNMDSFREDVCFFFVGRNHLALWVERAVVFDSNLLAGFSFA